MSFGIAAASMENSNSRWTEVGRHRNRNGSQAVTRSSASVGDFDRCPVVAIGTGQSTVGNYFGVLAQLVERLNGIEEVRGSNPLGSRPSLGAQLVGELLTCPYCIGTWISSARLYESIVKPRYTRVFASIFAINFVSDFCRQGYAKAKELNE